MKVFSFVSTTAWKLHKNYINLLLRKIHADRADRMTMPGQIYNEMEMFWTRIFQVVYHSYIVNCGTIEIDSHYVNAKLEQTFSVQLSLHINLTKLNDERNDLNLGI